MLSVAIEKIEVDTISHISYDLTYLIIGEANQIQVSLLSLTIKSGYILQI